MHVKHWNHLLEEGRYSVQLTRGARLVPSVQNDPISHVEVDMMYWRNANHIHEWFVENVQNGDDDFEEHRVSENKLRQFLDVCNQVIDASKLVCGLVDNVTVRDNGHHEGIVLLEPGKVIEDPTVAKGLLPTQNGFFYVTYDYDERYLKDVIATRDWLTDTLAVSAAGAPGHIVYSSS